MREDPTDRKIYPALVARGPVWCPSFRTLPQHCGTQWRLCRVACGYW